MVFSILIMVCYPVWFELRTVPMKASISEIVFRTYYELEYVTDYTFKYYHWNCHILLVSFYKIVYYKNYGVSSTADLVN